VYQIVALLIAEVDVRKGKAEPTGDRLARSVKGTVARKQERA
jgi:hypothetical protein